MRIVLVITAILSVVSPLSAQPGGAFFVPNQGQWNGDFLFRYQGPGITCFVTRTGMTLDLREYDRQPRRAEFDPFRERHEPVDGTVRGHVLRLSYVESHPSTDVIGEDKLESYSNYFLGRDSCRWRSFVPNYQRVVAKDVWPGIDVEYLAHSDGVETLFRVRPGADVSKIALEYEGLERPLEVDAQGNLLLHTSLGAVKEKAPWANQIIGSRRIEVPVSFRILGSTRYGLSLGPYDTSQELVIDPRLIYSTYFGGGYGIPDMKQDSAGNLVIVGDTGDNEFPITPGAYQQTMRGQADAFMSKLSPDGRELRFSTFIGSSGYEDDLWGVAVDIQGRVFAGGSTMGSDWPLTAGAFDTVFAGSYEGVFVCLSSDGSELLFSSFLGGEGNDFVRDVELDSSTGEVYVCGETGTGVGFPITPDALQPDYRGGVSFITIWDPANFTLAYSTFWGCERGTGYAFIHRGVSIGDRRVWIAGSIEQGGVLPVTEDAFQPLSHADGYEGFLAQLDLASGRIVYCSYLGGSNLDYCLEVLPLSATRVLLSGTTASDDFPVTPGAFDTAYSGQLWDVFISILDPPSVLVASTYLGGDGTTVTALGVNGIGDVVVTGATYSPDFPVTPDGMDTTLGDDQGGEQLDGVVCRLSADLSEVLYGTHFGGNNDDGISSACLSLSDTIQVAGEVRFCGFPITEDAFQPFCPGMRSNFVACLDISSSSGVAVPRAVAPQQLTLSCYPNPFNANTILRFTLPRSGSARLLVYDLLGRKVLDENLGRLPAGEYRHALDASDLPSGIYFARLEALGLERVQKMVILR